MRLLLAICVFGLCLTSVEALGRDESQPKSRWENLELEPAVGRDAESLERVWNLPQGGRSMPSDTAENDDLDLVFGHSGSFISQLRLPQEPFLATDGELVAHSASSAVPTATYAHQHWYGEVDDAPAIWITLAQRGLDYLKDVLLTQVLDAITPFPLPDITRTSNIPFVGEVSVSFTNVTLMSAKVPSSTIALSDVGIAMQGFNAAANLTLSWQYDYHNIWLPGPVSDFGSAEIKVVGMQAGVSVGVQEYLGTLHMSVLQCGAYIDDLEVQVKGGSSWLYQWLVDGLEERMRTTIEEQLSEQIQEGVQNLNSFLLQTPQQVQVDDTSELNFTVVSEPIVSPTSLSIGVKGQFVSPRSVGLVSRHIPQLPPGLVCNGKTKMVTMALSESILKDGAAIYYNADLLNWLLDKLPDQTFLNTSKWKFLIPQLYQQYPNKEITLHFEVSDLPNVTLTMDGVDVSASAQMIIGVADNGSNVQVACISVTASASGLAGLNGNNITGQVALKDISLELEWSNVGKIHLTLVKVFLKTLVKDALLPFVNVSLRRGFPLPVIPSTKLQGSTVDYGDGYLLVCTDLQYVENNRQ